MAEFKATKTAFVCSIISLLLSCAMLLGTTFAWFTDNVSSSNNRILAGNLDIDLLMYKSGEYASIAESSKDIFTEANGGKDINWEPGETEIVYFAVQNIGSLSLKYDIKLDIDGDLAGALEYAILDGEKAGNSNIENWSEIKNRQNGKLEVGLISIVENRELDKENVDYFAVAVHMPDGTENEYQGHEITANLTLVATQSSYE